MRTRASEIVIGKASPFDRADSATAVRVQIPEESGVGEAYAWVVVSGAASNLLPITIAK